MTRIIYAKYREQGKLYIWRVPQEIALTEDSVWALVIALNSRHIVKIEKVEEVQDEKAAIHSTVLRVDNTYAALIPYLRIDSSAAVGAFKLLDPQRIQLQSQCSYALEDQAAMKELAENLDINKLFTDPIGLVKKKGNYVVFTGSRRLYAVKKYLHWNQIPCFICKTSSVVKATHILSQAVTAQNCPPEAKLNLYETFASILTKMKELGEIKGGLQQRLVTLLNISERSVRYYKQMSLCLTQEEKYSLFSGTLDLKQARLMAVERSKKSGNIAAF